ncbi:hypothetical protein [Candidatus Borrarchaeum sp.]|uniref:hypothetical protein n=1 Tax=Candidatus Borrarchaeum sp. TaxID=2846742 RepID=UPI00257B3B2D|nr:hypothetical protein [Candidatus Borrarchaeum sp.]
MKKQSLEKILKKTIEEYNKYRTPEVIARLISIDNSKFRIEFTGHCHTCGFYDYFDDFRFLLEDFGLTSKIIGIKETDEGGIAKFSLK